MDETIRRSLTLRITGLKFFGFHGVYDDEKRIGSKYECDIDLVLASPPADDDLSAAYDYTKAMNIAAKYNSAKSYNLIESFAEDICRDIFEDANITRCTVRIRKYTVPVEHDLSYVEAEYTLSR